MIITCENCKQEFEGKLQSIPSEWREDILNFICSSIVGSNEDMNCEQIRECQTVTEISDFVITDSTVCLTFTNEDGVEVERCFDFNDIINNYFNVLDPKCIASESEWQDMLFAEKMQALIDKVCDTCTDAPTTTTTTTETPSTTTTTTVEESTTTTTTVEESTTTTTTSGETSTTTTTTEVCSDITGLEGVGSEGNP